jgi:ribosomal-protein-alanine N-acetyltransferase
MSLTFQIITTSDEDYSSALLFCQTLDLDFFPNPWTYKDWENLFIGPQDRLLIVAKKEELIIGLSLFDFSVADSFSHLLKILIHPSNRGQGFGDDLLNFSLKTLKAWKIETTFLEVEENNQSAIGLYEKYGFKKIHLKKHFYSNGENAWVMTRELL